MRNFKIVIEYDGSEFHGWQVQPALRTVQGELARAVIEVTGEHSRVVGAGRTDAGVHAAGQVANFLSATRLQPSALGRALNARLPADVRIRSIDEAPRDFNARFNARSRTYHYIFICRQTALWRRYYHFVEGRFDAAAVRRALGGIVGEHDFTSFTSAEEQGSRRCRILSADFIESPPLFLLALTADHYLHKMVRLIAGTVLEIGKGAPRSMKEILAARDPARSGPALPPHALYLMRVDY